MASIKTGAGMSMSSWFMLSDVVLTRQAKNSTAVIGERNRKGTVRIEEMRSAKQGVGNNKTRCYY